MSSFRVRCWKWRSFSYSQDNILFNTKRTGRGQGESRLQVLRADDQAAGGHAFLGIDAPSFPEKSIPFEEAHDKSKQ
jgi:hypothetical protein